MTKQLTDWLEMKKQNIRDARVLFAHQPGFVDSWEDPKYLAIIAELQREIRRLKTKLAAKVEG